MQTYNSTLNSAVNTRNIAQFNLMMVELIREYALQTRQELLEDLDVCPEVAELFTAIPGRALTRQPAITLQPICELYHGRGDSYWLDTFKELQEKPVENPAAFSPSQSARSLFLQIVIFTAVRDMRLAEFYTGATESVIQLFLNTSSRTIEKLVVSGTPIFSLRNGEDENYWRQVLNAYFHNATQNEEEAAYHTMMLYLANQLPSSGLRIANVQ